MSQELQQNIPPVICLFGPTAVGKTELIERCFSRGFEIISADALQVYRSLDIGTAKPDSSLLRRIPHHLIDILTPNSEFSAGDFVSRSDSLCGEIRQRGRIPLISGGTAFYFKSFLYGLSDLPPVDPELRQDLNRQLREEGSAALFQRLKQLDPVRAGEIHPNNSARVLRSLEVCLQTGKPHSSFPPPDTPRSSYRFLLLGLWREREELYRRIDTRVDQMFDEGLEREIAELQERYAPEDPGMKGIGYREFFLYPGKEREMIKRNSRRYAKRQITFFSSLKGVQWYRPEQEKEIAERVQTFIGEEK